MKIFKSVGYFKDFNIMNHRKTWHLNSEFTFVAYNMSLNGRTIEYNKSQDFTKIKWHFYKNEPETSEYYFSINLYRDVTNTFTTLVVEWEFHKDIDRGESINNNNVNKIRTAGFVEIDSYIKTKSYKFQQERIIINCAFEAAKSLISDLRSLKENVPIFCDKVEFEGDINIGTIISFTTRIKNFIGVAYFKVESIKDKENNFKISYFCNESNPPVPKQRIFWSLTKLPQNQCLIKFTHHYKGFVSEEILKFSSRQKNKILKQLKIVLEAK